MFQITLQNKMFYLLPHVDTIQHALPEKHKNNMKLNNINRTHKKFIKHFDQAHSLWNGFY